MQGYYLTYLVVLRSKVGDQRLRIISPPTIDMTQHDCLVKCLGCCNLTVVAAQVEMLASHSDVALPFLRALVLSHTMVARGLCLQSLFFTPAESALSVHLQRDLTVLACACSRCCLSLPLLSLSCKHTVEAGYAQSGYHVLL